MHIIDKLLDNKVEIRPGLWVVARPLVYRSFIERIKDAYDVFIGKTMSIAFLENTINDFGKCMKETYRINKIIESKYDDKIIYTIESAEFLKNGIWDLKPDDKFFMIDPTKPGPIKIYTASSKPFINSCGRIAIDVKDNFIKVGEENEYWYF